MMHMHHGTHVTCCHGWADSLFQSPALACGAYESGLADTGQMMLAGAHPTADIVGLLHRLLLFAKHDCAFRTKLAPLPSPKCSKVKNLAPNNIFCLRNQRTCGRAGTLYGNKPCFQNFLSCTPVSTCESHHQYHASP